jgi:hypothetical protein
MNENWLCKHCQHYKGMIDKGASMPHTRCGAPKWQKYFEKGKDYLLHYASGRPNWCNTAGNLLPEGE